MKSIPNIDYGMLKTADQKPVGKYGNLANFLQERSGVSIDDATLDKKLRTFFEDLITEILKNPAEWDRTKNINFMELFNYLEEQEQQKGQEEQGIKPMGKQAAEADEQFFKGDKVILLSDIQGMKGKIGTVVDINKSGFATSWTVTVAFGDKKEYPNKGGWVSSVEYGPLELTLSLGDIDHYNPSVKE